MAKGALYNIIEDICSFLVREVILYEGKYHDTTNILARPEFRVLTEISKLKFSRGSY
jgi:hypothetical protein